MSSQFFLWDQSEKIFFFACPMLKIFDTMPFAFDEWITFHGFRRTVKFTALLYNKFTENAISVIHFSVINTTKSQNERHVQSPLHVV
jgi:hypothetical protein